MSDFIESTDPKLNQVHINTTDQTDNNFYSKNDYNLTEEEYKVSY